MPAPKDNQFWKLRSKHGKDKLFSTPELLEEAANEYFDYCDSNPIYKSEVLKGGDKAGTIAEVPIQRPYLIEGLCVYLGVYRDYLDQFERSLDTENSKKDKEYYNVLMRIREKIKGQKLDGATVGIYNPLIVSRIEGLRDRQEINQTSDVKVTVTDQEAQRIAKKIREDI